MKKITVFSGLIALSGSLWAGCSHAAASCGSSSGAKTPLLFLTLGLGYYLLRLAESETNKVLKIVGRVVSWGILVGSLLGFLCGLCGKCRPAAGAMACGPKKAAAACPHSGSPSAVAPADAPVEKQ